MSSTPTCSQCLRRMVYTDKGWTCPHQEPQPPTDQGELEQILDGIDHDDSDDDTGWWETSTGAEFGAQKLAEIKAYVARERAAANLNGYKNGISVGAVIAKQAIENGEEPLTVADEFTTALTPNQQERQA